MSESETPKERIQFDLRPKELETLDRLKDELGCSRAEVAKRALAFYQAVVDADERGEKIVFHGEDGKQKILILPW